MNSLISQILLCGCGEDDDIPYIPIGLPFVGGSDDPTSLIGLEPEEGGAESTENVDPGI
jgi:hypothetical protein